MSLDIRIDDHSVDLSAGSSLELNLTNPHFDYGKIAGMVANLPPFPLTLRNRRIFGYWDQPQAGGILQRHRLGQYYNGQLIREAVYLLTEAGPTGYTGQAVEPIGEFFGDWTNRPLTELDLGTVELPSVVPPSLAAAGLVFPTIVNPDFYGTNGPVVGYTGKVNDYAGGGYLNTPARPLVPMLTVKSLLERIARATGVAINGPVFMESPPFSNLILYNTRALDVRTTVVVNQHVPGLTVAELFLELRRLLNLQLEFNTVTRRLRIGFWDPCLNQPASRDWSRKAVGPPVKTPELNTRLQLSYELDGGDGLMKDKPAEMADYLSPGEGSLASLKSKFSTLLVDSTTGTAKAAQPGITEQFGQLTQAFAPRLLFWNGVIGGLPSASAISVSGSASLFWAGESGLVNRIWSGLEQMRRTQFYVKQAVDLTETDLAGLAWDQKVHINGTDYFVLSVTVSLPIRKPAECLLVAG